MTADEIIFSDNEKDILQEIMNIAFGSASADLAKVIELYVVLSVPNIQLLKMKEIGTYLDSSTAEFDKTAIIEQKFWGDLKGSSFLVFPYGESVNFNALLSDSECGHDDVTFSHDEVLMEVGNIMIGACVGKLSELLNTFVTYSPPQLIFDQNGSTEKAIGTLDQNQTVIAMKTLFEFENQDISGFLLLLTNEESIQWLKNALNDFMDAYE